MKKFTDIDLLKEIGERVGMKKYLICPLCSDEGGEQSLSSFGNHENELFCPHCDLHLELKLVDKGVNKGRFKDKIE